MKFIASREARSSRLIISLFAIITILLLASLFGSVNAAEIHKNGFDGITPLNTTGLTVFNDSLKRSFDYDSDSLVLSAEFSILETNGDIRDFSLFDNDLTRQNTTPSPEPEFVSSTFRTGLETIPEASQFFYNESMSVPIYWVAQIYPSSIYYNDRTYFVWQGEDMDPFITYYNHTTDIWATPVEVGDNPLDPGDADYHGGPAILIDANGFIHVFFGVHTVISGDGMKHAKSDSAEDISSWTLQANPAGTDSTYPQLVQTPDDHIFLAYRRDVSHPSYKSLVYRESADNASSWGAITTVVDFGADWVIYPFNWELEGTDQLHFAFRAQEYTPNEVKRSYHAILNTTDDKIYSITGVDLGAIVSRTEADNNLVVNETSNGFIFIGTLHLDSSGNPYLIQTNQEDTSEGWNQTFIRWNGTGWESEIITPAGIPGSPTPGTADFIINSSTDIEAYLITDSGVGKDIERWSWNGSTWTQEQVLLTAITSGENLTGPSIPQNNNAELRVFFSQVDRTDFTNNDLEVYAHDGTDFVLGEISIGGQWAEASHSATLDMETTNVSMVWWGQTQQIGLQYITGKGCSTTSYVYGLYLESDNTISAYVADNGCSWDIIQTALPNGGLNADQTYGIGAVFENNTWGTVVHLWLDGEWIYNETSTETVGDTDSVYYIGRSSGSAIDSFCECIHDEILVFKDRLDNNTMKLLTTKQHDIVIKSGPRTTTQGFEGLFFALPWLIVFGLLGWLFYVIVMACREPFTRD